MTTHPTELGARRHLVVSQRLRERRRDLGLTQKQVITRLARLGVASNNKALSSLEHGSGIDVAKLPELAAALDCTVTWLLGLTRDPARWEPDEDQPARRGTHIGSVTHVDSERASEPAPEPACEPSPVPIGATRPRAGTASYPRSIPRVIGPIASEE
ncbi:MAG: helix-turn-helix domain-containing protein [Intrasporangium sp.]|uniref:helix-turn-helix domain-containing protein n=1 Tax=Intrasporangium sp. TaxID=1925024 RepID=UPI003F800EEC